MSVIPFLGVITLAIFAKAWAFAGILAALLAIALVASWRDKLHL